MSDRSSHRILQPSNSLDVPGAEKTGRRRWMKQTLGGLTLLALPACVTKPTMKLNYARVSGVGPLGIGMDVFLNVENDNSFDVQVRRVRGRSTIQDRWLLPPMDYSPNVWLQADGITPVQAPVFIPWPMVLPLLAETVAFPELRYRVEGTADVTATSTFGLQVDAYPVNEVGVVPRAAIVAAAQSTFPGAV